jgi:hypothetical protein
MKIKILATASIGLLVILPLLIDHWLSVRDEHYDEIVANYECQDGRCEADFNGDGVSGRVEPLANSVGSQERSIVITEAGRQLALLPYWSIDGTFRTHVAVRKDEMGARLIVFDGTQGQDKISSLVFVWKDGAMVPVTPHGVDREILSAMAARDDAGSWNQWALYRTVSIPALVAYYFFLAGIAIGFVIRHRIRGVKSKTTA